MRIVKLSDLSEEEKKRVLEEQQTRIKENNQARQQLQQNANNQFNELINREGSYDTNKHTYRVSDMKNNSSKDYWNTFKKSNNMTLLDYITGNFNNNISTWNQVQNVANNNLNRFNNINNTKNLINNLSNNSNNSALVNYVFNSSGNAVNRQRENKNMLTKSEDTNKNQTIFDVMQNKEIRDNKDSMLFSEQDNKIVPMKVSDEGSSQKKNKNIIQDSADVAVLMGLGVSTGSKEVLNYIESANENIFSNYKNLRKQQFLTSPNVSEDKKAIAKTQDNLLLQKNGINIEDKVETNLVKKAIRDSISKDEEEIAKRQSRISNKGMQKLGELAPSMGQMIPGTIANAVNPILGMAYFTSSSGGSYINDALNKGMNEEQAFRYGTIMGVLEGASESYITGQQVNKIAKAFNGKQIISQKLLDSYGFNIFENAVQEAVMEPAQELTAMITGGSDKADWSDIFLRMAESGFNGGLMGAITNGVTYGLEKSGKIYNKIKNGENVTANEYKEALQENIEQFGKETVEENIRQGAIETYQELNNASQREDLVLKTLINSYQENNSQLNTIANNQNSVYNNIALGEVKNIPIEDVLPLKTDGGYRNEQQMSKLREDIKKNSITNPIELVRNSDGSIEIENGNHRLQIANELGLKEVPVKFVENWDNIGNIDKTETKYNDYIESLEISNDRNNSNSEKINIINDGNRINEEYNINDRNELKNRTTTTRNDSISGEIQRYNDRPSSNTTFEENSFQGREGEKGRETVKNSKESSFSNNKNQTLNLPTRETIQRDNNQQTPNLPVSENMKQRKHYKSIMESPYTSKEAKSIAKELMGTDTYVPESNKKQLARADERISIGGADSELNSLMSGAMTGGNIKADDIAVGERLIQYYSKSGDKAKLQDAIQATAMAGTSAGQTVQALSLLNHQTPEGQAIWIQRSVEKMNNDLRRTRGEKAQQFDLTPDMIEKIVNSKNTEELQNNVNEVYEELGQQVSKTVWQKIDSWRYFSMLFNVRTHLRNVIGNTAMGTTQRIKNKTAGIIEGVVSKVNPEMERTHTIVPASKEVKQFAKNDIANVADRLGLNDNKYNPKSRIENSMRTFKSGIMENTVGKMFNFNDKTLEAEDGFGLKMAYKNALAEYMTANKLTPENITDEKLSKARNYAIEQAKEATFHQESKIASLLNQLSNKNKFAKATMDATLPFKKTPINVAKSGLEYSPVGLIKSIVYDSVELRKGNITANKYIDNISKGLTGTGIALVGYALADMGILKASGGDDDKKEKYDEAMGNQTYAITIGDKTYSLDWLAPSGIPLFIGAELKQIVNTKAETKTTSTDSNSSYNQILETGSNLLNAFSNAMNPMAEMSMLSGLTSALQSYEQGSSQMFAELGTNAVKSYVNQYVPTVLGQVAKTADDYERSTTSTKTGVLPKAIDTTKNQIMSKIPGLRQMLPVKTDIWGNDVKQNENIVARSFENGVLPWTEKKVESNKVNDALNALYDKTGESSIYPKNIEKTFTINGEKNRLTTEEYSKYQKSYGQTSYKLINNLVSSKEYKNMNDLQKQKAIEEVYSYAKEKNKIDYAKKIKKDLEPSTLYTIMEELKTNSGNQSEYLNYISRIEGLKKDREKNEILFNASYSNITKSIIYKNTTGSEDDIYNNILSKDNIDINEYLNYKLQEFESDKEDDGTLQGKSVSGSKKKKVYDYVNNMKITPQQKITILGTQYKLSRNEQRELYSYIDNISNQTKDEKLEIFKKYSSNFIINKNGTLTLK